MIEVTVGVNGVVVNVETDAPGTNLPMVSGILAQAAQQMLDLYKQLEDAEEEPADGDQMT